MATPRDRNGYFEPQLVKKHQTTLSDELERKIIRLFALGMSYQDISREIEDLYAFSVSTATISAVTDKVIPELKQWQQRPLEKVYPFVWLDAIHYKIREDGCYQSKAVYTVLALNLEGKKEVLGLYLSESEGANFWLSVLSDLQNRGVEDILIACVDGLTGFPEAINSIYPQTEVQLCVIHQIRNSIKYVASKHHKAFMADLKPVYRAVSETALDELEAKRGSNIRWCSSPGAARGKSVSVLPLSGEYPQGDLHNQRDRISPPPVQETDQNLKVLSRMKTAC
ncbi:IS256 family transposase [Escherichia coli]|nr:IS256 family transposase [Escherichia coli]